MRKSRKTRFFFIYFQVCPFIVANFNKKKKNDRINDNKILKSLRLSEENESPFEKIFLRSSQQNSQPTH